MQLRPSVKLIGLAYLAALFLAIVIAAICLTIASGNVLWWSFMLIPASVAVMAAARHLRRRLTCLTIEGGRLRFESGLLSKSTRTMDLAKVQDVRVEQTFGQRLLGVGDLSLETAGETSRLVMLAIDQPQQATERILDLARHNEHPDASKTSGPSKL